MDLLGVVGIARAHAILMIVLTASWGFGESWLAHFRVTERLFYPLLRPLAVTTGAGLLSFPAGLFSDVNAVFVTVASLAIVSLWGAAAFQTVIVVAPHIVPTLEHPLLVKHTSGLLKADWFMQTRKAYNEFYTQAFSGREED